MQGKIASPSPQALRRIALKSQGLLGRRRIGSGVGGLAATLERLGYIQIDTISVVARAHNHTAWVRTANFAEKHFNRLVEQQQAFEYWYHAASYLPMRDYRFALPRMRAIKAHGYHRRPEDKKLMAYVKDRIREQGALTARDFESPPRKSNGWWDWKPAKRALESLYMQGELMVAGREGFAKRYDLTERVVPSSIDTRAPSVAEVAEHLVDNALAANGFAGRSTFLHGRKASPLQPALRNLLDARLAQGRLVAFARGRELYYAPPENLVTPRKPASVVRILSPFDNSVILRSRCQAIFEFDFVLECYVTETRRRWGYYSLPVLYGDEFVGRMDCKAHRDAGRFEIKHLYVERGVDDDFPPAFQAAVREYAAFNGCEDVTISAATPRRFQAAVSTELRQ